jgi:TetR/AcrR family transcriptional repressor of nem operon
MARRKRARPLSREDLIARAADLFRAKGFDGTTLDDVSRQTGVSRFKLYAWFGSKEGILSAAFNATWAQINEKVANKLQAEMDLRHSLEVLLTVVLDFAERRDPIAALFLQFSRRTGVDAHLQPEVLRFNRVLEGTIRRALERGEITPIKPPLLRAILFALGEGLLYQIYVAENRPGVDAEFELGEIPAAVMRVVEPLLQRPKVS